MGGQVGGFPNLALTLIPPRRLLMAKTLSNNTVPLMTHPDYQDSSALDSTRFNTAESTLKSPTNYLDDITVTSFLSYLES